MVTIREELMRLIREEFDPTPKGWEGRYWNDNAEEVADKILAYASTEIAQGEAEPVAWQVKLVADSSWLETPPHRVDELKRDAHAVRPLFTSPPDTAAIIARLEQRVAVAEMERDTDIVGKEAIAELLGITDEIRWKWIRNAILKLQEKLSASEQRLAEAERVIAPMAAQASMYDPPEGDDHEQAFAATFLVGELRAAAKWMEGNHENM